MKNKKSKIISTDIKIKSNNNNHYIVSDVNFRGLEPGYYTLTGNIKIKGE